MQIETITTTERLEDLAADWDDLWSRAPDATPFQSPHWLLPWWRLFRGGDLHSVAVYDGDRLTALAPLYILRDDDSGESLGLLLGTGVSDYLDALIMPGMDSALLLRAAANADCQMWDLQQLRTTSPLLGTPLPDGWSDNVDKHDRCPVLTLEGAGGELENLTSTYFRKKLRYYRRCAEREGSVRYESATEENLDLLTNALFDLHSARWRQRGLPGVLADDVIQQFHCDVARRMLAAGMLRMYAMHIGDRIAAVFYGFAHRGTVYFYLSGYDPSLEKLSLGTVIVAHAIEEAIRDSARTFDFLRGAEDYKYAWGAKDRVNLRRQLFRSA